jgi:hypothetical protein
LVAGLTAVWLVPAVAWAIGPNDQKIPDPPTPLSIGATGVLSGGEVGTGTVIGAQVAGTTGYVAILTANHVAAAGETDFAIGAGTGANPYSIIFQTGAFVTYTINDPQNNPKNLPEDISLILGTETGLNQGSTALALFKLLGKNVPTITNPQNNPFPAASATNKVPFTQIGYGLQGQYNANINIDGKVVQGYEGTNVKGERLFENNLAISYKTPAVDPYLGKYFEPITTFNVIAPNAAGQGGGLPGDSGGPMYTQPPGNPVSVTVNRGGNNIQIPISYTNSLSAVWEAFAAATDKDGKVLEPPTILVGSPQVGVPIDQGLYNWIKPFAANPQSIPEPSSLVLLGLGSLGFLVWSCRRRSAAMI